MPGKTCQKLRPTNDPGPQMIRTANDPQTGPQMIPGPEMSPASDTAEKLNGVDSKIILWMYNFFNYP